MQTIHKSNTSGLQSVETSLIRLKPKSVHCKEVLLYECSCSYAVVWNPWEEKAKAMGDFGDDEVMLIVYLWWWQNIVVSCAQYPNMVCVEAGHVSEKVNLPAKQTFEASQTIQISKL